MPSVAILFENLIAAQINLVMQGSPLHLPRKQQWALLYEHQRRQHQRFQSEQRQKERLRKLAFKQALDQHIIEKRSMSFDQKMEDARYIQDVQRKIRMQEEEDEKKRIQGVKKRKAIEANNLQTIEYKRNHHESDIQNVYMIGIEDVWEMRKKNETNKRLLQKELQQQLSQRDQLKQLEKIKQLQTELANKTYELQKQQEKLVELEKYGRYKQNIDVYNHYSKLKQEKNMKEKELKRRLVDLPASQRQRLEEERVRREHDQKSKKVMLMKQSLLSQIEAHNKAKASKDNSAMYGNKMYDEFYKDKRPKFDRDQYLRTLSKQREQQRHRRDSLKYMSEQQYKLNLNYLDKAVNGRYSVPMRYDRATFQIGNPEQVSRRRDQIYFNKLGSRQARSTESSIRKASCDREKTPRPNPQMENENDLQLIKDKIQRLMMSRQAKARYESTKQTI